MAVTDSTIGNLPVASALGNSDKFAIEQEGEAKSVTASAIKTLMSASPAFTGTPTAPTPSENASDSQIPNVGYVKSLIDTGDDVEIVDYASASATLFNKINTAYSAGKEVILKRTGTAVIEYYSLVNYYHLNSTYSFTFARVYGITLERYTLTKIEGGGSGGSNDYSWSTGTYELAKKDSPAFTGVPTAPTAPEGTDTTQIATTAFVKRAIDNIPEIEVDTELSDTSENPVQNKVITDALIGILPEETESGAIVSVSDAAPLNAKKLVVNIDPVQNLHGQSAPYPAGGGKNKLQVTATTQTINGVTFTVNADGTVNVNGTASDNAMFILHSALSLPDGTYKIYSGAATDSTKFVCSNYASGTRDYSPDPSVPISGNAINPTIYISSGTTVSNMLFKPMIMLATEQDTSFAPYSNICPISGWTGAKITDTGIDICNEDFEQGDIGYATGGNITGNSWSRTSYFPIPQGETLYCKSSATTVNAFFYDADKNYLGQYAGGLQPNIQNTTFTTPSNAYFMRIAYKVYPYANDFSTNYPSTETSYHAYNGSTVNIDWTDEAGVVYGGTLTYIGGGKYSLQATTAIKTLTGAEGYTWTKYGDNTLYNTSAILIGRRIGTAAIYGKCSHVGEKPVGSGLIDYDYLASTSNSAYGLEFHRCATYWGLSEVSSAALNAKLAEFYAAGTPFQIVYDLATLPDPIILTAEDLVLLLGNNNVWANTGDSELTYAADIKLYIDKKLAEVTA